MESMTLANDGARVHGFGTQQFKWVSGLTDEERATVRAGGIVFVDSGRPADGSHGPTWRVVTVHTDRSGKTRWGRRVPTVEEWRAACEQWPWL